MAPTPGPDLVIIGGGPAGLACALQACAVGLEVAIVDALGLGGQLLNLGELSLPGHPDGVSGPDLAATLMEQIMDAGARVHFGQATELEPDGERWRVGGPGLEESTAGAVVMATGTRPDPLGVPGEQELAGHGLSTCAACDGPLFAGQPVVVVGGGETALYEAAHLTKLGSTVTLLVPEASSLPRSVRNRLLGAGTTVDMIDVIRVSQIEGHTSVTGVSYIDDEGAPVTIATAAVFVAHRRLPVSDPARTVVETDADEQLTVDERCRTGHAGLFAAGDVRSGSPRTVLAAMADGHMAATGALHHLSRGV